MLTGFRGISETILSMEEMELINSMDSSETIQFLVVMELTSFLEMIMQ